VIGRLVVALGLGLAVSTTVLAQTPGAARKTSTQRSAPA
jgi:hypothetical protein